MDTHFQTTLDDVSKRLKQGYYDYIVVGSGMGGGILARTLVEGNPKHCPEHCPIDCPKDCSVDCPGDCPHRRHVLLIEWGGWFLTTHCLNDPAPRWNPLIGDGDGPPVDNFKLFGVAKKPVKRRSPETSTFTEYAGGPMHHVGGRSTVWGLFTPAIDKDQAKKYFPRKVYNYLFDNQLGGYSHAYRLLSNNPNATISSPYPVEQPAKKIIERLNEVVQPKYGWDDFGPSPMAAEFPLGQIGSEMFTITMGGYSTVSWMMRHVVSQSKLLTILSGIKVVAVDRTAIDQHPNRVANLIVSDHLGREHVLDTGGATVILSAGTIDTAAIALRSGLRTGGWGGNKLVSIGLMDHEIKGIPLEMLVDKDDESDVISQLKGRALRLQNWVSLETGAEKRCLLNVIINAPSPLGRAHDESLQVLYIDDDGTLLDKKRFEKKLEMRAGERKFRRVSIMVIFGFYAELQDENKVVDETTVQITSETFNGCKFERKMKRIASDILRALRPPIETDYSEGMRISDFGEVAHEVGTMRMGQDRDTGVVDENLCVYEWGNLFVCDLSVFPVSPSANPSLTLAALAQRLGAHLWDSPKLPQVVVPLQPSSSDKV
ncbi:hypothetical protein EG329_011375 [Mollisiaceae sp. DMI_Dod_QoI]|nr:hypothetical protein EG329_011375 [Helotiales sp. DMI_Dod_QoI]